ncbi:DEAD/DEAH box helicase [Paenibacillus marinisediminis]
MSSYLTLRLIKMLCGKAGYEEGQAYHRANRVYFHDIDPDYPLYEAVVKDGSEDVQVHVKIDRSGDVNANCSCCSFASTFKYCEHVAAVLLNIAEMQQDGRLPILSDYDDTDESRVKVERHREDRADGSENSTVSIRDMRISNSMMELFGHKQQRTGGGGSIFDTRECLEVEFTIKPFAYGDEKFMFGVEMKLGPKRLYVVQRIRDLLDRIDRGVAYEFSKYFTYEPERYRFHPEQAVVLQYLAQIYRHERMFHATSKMHYVPSISLSGDRMLLIPPFSWESLFPLLEKSPMVKLRHNGKTYDGLQVSDELIPLNFVFEQAGIEGYQLDIEGLDQVTVMEDYGVVLCEGKLIKLPVNDCNRLSDMKLMLASSYNPQIQLAPEQMEPFMEKVIPGLMKLGSVRIAKEVSDRLMQVPLKAKLYLDRVRGRLLAGLEFHYGEIVINPLDANGYRGGTERILVREGEKEHRILELMDHCSFTKTEYGYFLDDEDSEYEFLYHIVPQLEPLAEIHATTAVKLRIFKENAAPVIRVNVDERTDWLEFKFEIDGIPESDIRKLLQTLDEKRKYYRLPDGALMPLETEEFQEIVRFMNETGIHFREWNGARAQLPVARGLHLLDTQPLGSSIKLSKSFRKLLENMRNPDNLDFVVPEHLEGVLRDYQIYGYQWLKTLAHYRFGGILADDMGLGKTLQSIAFIVSELAEIREQKQPALIVSPSSLVYNWRNEIQKFAPELRVTIVDGNRTDRSSFLQDVSEVDVLITSYPLLRRDIALYEEQMFHSLILDEAQVFKNYYTLTAQVVKEIKAKYRFALTGTPVENRLEELWSIFDVVFPDLFPGRREFNDLPREMVAKRVRPFLLRRLKTEVLKELPEKIESVQASELLPEQKKLYMAYLAQLQQETLKHLSEDGYQKYRIKILSGLTRLRQLCCHPALFVEGYEGSSAKFEQLLEIIEECRSAGRRILLFSQFTSMLDIIGRNLAYQGVPYFYLDGQTPLAERVQLCNRFNDGERDMFLISLKAGGTGLNLTGADTVILYDLWWNPAVEQQAADRAYRIGQKKVVQVIRLITQGTVEEKMYELQHKKMQLIEEVVQPGHEELSSLTEQDIREILMLG